jgi:hypothetical protein
MDAGTMHRRSDTGKQDWTRNDVHGVSLASLRNVLPDCMHDQPARQPSRPRMITHGNAEEEHAKKIDRAQVREGRWQERGERDEEARERHAAERERRERWEGDEQKAGDRHRTFGGAQEGREGAVEAEVSDAAGDGRDSIPEAVM